MLTSLPKFESYSQYYSSLDKVFHENSIKSFLNTLKFQKKPKIFSVFDSNETKPPTRAIFNSLATKKYQNDLMDFSFLDTEVKTNKNLKYSKKEGNYTSRRALDNSATKHKKYDPALNPFRYNPNYNSIYKNIPSVHMRKPLKFSIKKNKNKKNAFLTGIENNSLNYLYNHRNKKLKSLDYVNKGRQFKIFDSNNHTLRFDKYSKRKYLKTDINPNISYINLFDYKKMKNSSIDFNKMITRNDNIFFPNRKMTDGPSIGYYRPRYDYFDQKKRSIFLGNQPKKKIDKNFLLKKLWASYKINLDYQLIDNKKLNNDILKGIKLNTFY